VIITTYNRPDYLAQSLGSVLKQSILPMQIIVVDDGSDCDYQDVIHATDFTSLVYVKLPNKMGANAARNYGVSKAKGDIVAFLDDDDTWLPHFLESHIECYRKDSKASAVVCGFQIMGSDLQRINTEAKVSEASLRLGNKFCGMSGVSAKRSVLLDCSFDETLQNGQDWDLFVRLVCAKRIIRNISAPLFQYRKNTPNSISTVTKTLTIDKSDARLASAYKHQHWLGEIYFKKRVADQLLTFILQKPDKLKWIMKSVNLAGFRITFSILVNKLIR
jgi:glycosyltransferase involved in cell wall biosynthesis